MARWKKGISDDFARKQIKSTQKSLNFGLQAHVFMTNLDLFLFFYLEGFFQRY